MQIGSKLNDGKTIATIEVMGQKRDVSATELDEMIKQLAALRATMQPARPRQPPQEETFTVSMSPFWQVLNEPVMGGTLIRILDGGLGWLNVLIPPADADVLSEAVAKTNAKVKAQAAEPQAANG